MSSPGDRTGRIGNLGRTSLPGDGGATGVVLAGGRSSRFGRDKLDAEYRGRPLLHHVVLRLAEVCPDLVVVIAPETPTPELPGDIPIQFARDAEPAEGPLAGLAAGLELVKTELCIVAGGDMPDLSSAVLTEMLRKAREAKAASVVLRDRGELRPLPAILTCSHALVVARRLLLDGERSLRALHEALDALPVEEEAWVSLDPDRRTLVDVDVPTDLE
jgi:molybdenum cofactor guanylyltransferase